MRASRGNCVVIYEWDTAWRIWSAYFGPKNVYKYENVSKLQGGGDPTALVDAASLVTVV